MSSIHPLRVSQTEKSVGGFTLLEILIVLALIATMAALAGPALYDQLESANERGVRDQLVARITALAGVAEREVTAYQLGTEVITPSSGFTRTDAVSIAPVSSLLNPVHGSQAPYMPVAALTASAKTVDVPIGWKLNVDYPIRFAANGYCSGGMITVVSPRGREDRFMLREPFCDEAIAQ